MSNAGKFNAQLLDEFEHLTAMNPNVTIDELNVIAQHKMNERNNQPLADFCGLTPTQMSNWLYAPFTELSWLTINTPDDFSASPVMRYLALIIEEAMRNGGSFKATSKGNLPTVVVRQASALLPEFAVAQYEEHISISEFAGSNEDKFNALHYTRVLAEIAGIVYRRSGRYHVKKTAQKQYQKHGIHAFFMPMLEAATHHYNWAYLDSWEHQVDLRTFWVFMLWRIQAHGSVDQLLDEVVTAFPDVLRGFLPDDYASPTQLLKSLIESRFIDRFLQFWGFVIISPRHYISGKRIARKAEIQPLLKETFRFEV